MTSPRLIQWVLLSVGVRTWLCPRLRFLAPFLIAAGLLSTGLSRLRSVIRDSGRVTNDLGLLSARMESLDQAVRDADADQVPGRYESVYGSMRGGESEVATWLNATEADSRRLGLIVRQEVGDVESTRLDQIEVLQIPIRFYIRSTPDPGGVVMPVRQFLQWVTSITRSERRADIIDLSVRSLEGGTLEAAVVVRLWVVLSRS